MRGRRALVLCALCRGVLAEQQSHHQYTQTNFAQSDQQTQTQAQGRALKGSPYGGEVGAMLPGVLEVERVDAGGAGVSFSLSPDGESLPSQQVGPQQLTGSTEPAGDVAMVFTGAAAKAAVAAQQQPQARWARYTVQVQQEGTYVPTWRLAAQPLAKDGVPHVTAAVVAHAQDKAKPCEGAGLATVLGPGAATPLSTFRDVAGAPVRLSVGRQVLTVCVEAGASTVYVDRITFALAKPLRGRALAAAPCASSTASFTATATTTSDGETTTTMTDGNSTTSTTDSVTTSTTTTACDEAADGAFSAHVTGNETVDGTFTMAANADDQQIGVGGVCLERAAACASDAQCCGQMRCKDGACHAARLRCGKHGAQCGDTAACCKGATCTEGKCAVIIVEGAGTTVNVSAAVAGEPSGGSNKRAIVGVVLGSIAAAAALVAVVVVVTLWVRQGRLRQRRCVTPEPVGSHEGNWVGRDGKD